MPTPGDLQCLEISRYGISPKAIAAVHEITPEQEEDQERGLYQSSNRETFLFWRKQKVLLWHKLHWLEKRQKEMRLWGDAAEEEARAYSLPLVEVFHQAAAEVPTVSVHPNTMAGAPCIAGTRIPVYGILDALEDHGTLEGVLKSYPRLTLEQVKDAVLFAKLVVECPVGD